MAREGYRSVAIELPVNPTQEQTDELNMLMNAWHNAMVVEQNKIARAFNVSAHDASCIQYLRTRARWTQEKEDELVRLAQAGEELPNVFAGDF